MVISETVTMNDRQYTKTYSDSGYYIERSGTMYVEAIDPLGSGREYVETDKLIHYEPETVEQRINRIDAETSQNSADIEYIAMMSDISLDE